MRQHIKTLHHHPKRVATISIVIALVVGILGYLYISHTRNFSAPDTSDSTGVSQANSPSGNLSLGFLASGRIKSVSVKAGDVVKKDQVLATLDAGNVLGALQQASAAYKVAEANYQKVINGATGPNIDVARSAVNTAKANLEHVTSQQNTLVLNAQRKLYSDGLVAEPSSDNIKNGPTISGTYNGTQAGDYLLSFNENFNFNYGSVHYVGLETGNADVDTLPRALGTKGLSISWPTGTAGHTTSDSWVVHIPNTTGANYTNNLNAYQSAVESKNQAIASAESALDQANATFTAVVTAARPEDVATAQAQVQSASGALAIAEAAYKNTIIVAPTDGTVVSVAIVAGQIAVPNASAIEFISNGPSN